MYSFVLPPSNITTDQVHMHKPLVEGGHANVNATWRKGGTRAQVDEESN